MQLRFGNGHLPPELDYTLRRDNPWWSGKSAQSLPRFRRWIFARVQRSLKTGLTPAVVLRGPRRVGKTVLVRQLIESLLSAGVAPHRVLYIAFDELPSLRGISEPILAIAGWFETQVVGRSFNESARDGEKVFLFLDEVQNLDAWAPQIKHLVDNHDVRVVVTGSSSLRIEAGRDSLAGRITTLDLGPLLLREIAGLRFGEEIAPFWPDNGLDALASEAFWRDALKRGANERDARRRAFAAFSQRGAYPVAHDRPDVSWPELADHLNETIVKRAIQHDLRMGARGLKRDERLLEEVFRLSCRYAGQVPKPSALAREIQTTLAGNVGMNRILNYLRFLDGTLLIRLVPPLELRLKKQRTGPKITLCDHALRASWLQEVVPLDPDELAAEPHLTDLAGRLAESTLGYFLSSIPNLEVAHLPERGGEPEVDFVLTVGTRRIPIEVKYRRRIDPHEDTRVLRAFLEKTAYNAPFGLLVTLDDDVTVRDPRIVPISLSTLLWLR